MARRGESTENVSHQCWRMHGGFSGSSRGHHCCQWMKEQLPGPGLGSSNVMISAWKLPDTTMEPSKETEFLGAAVGSRCLPPDHIFLPSICTYRPLAGHGAMLKNSPLRQDSYHRPSRWQLLHEAQASETTQGIIGENEAQLLEFSILGLYLQHSRLSCFCFIFVFYFSNQAILGKMTLYKSFIPVGKNLFPSILNYKAVSVIEFLE